ncbi:uncharacterized protein KY384_005118 [Bacidia gigantensis]|uniref:uncharacterized protein n=1 Tax=Bacidia gigantensis TaxID=2732470 RepID=UPI001D04CBB7|nr:uncharacterized protein KY384_005118 [Bacidia gigantensis]KAG8529637.1 hypothetical protein KY384_005118 [Bacidia gigantensis]
MFGFDDAQDAHQQVYQQDGGWENPKHEAKFSHEMIAGAASFEGFKLYEDHQRKEGVLAHTPPHPYTVACSTDGDPLGNTVNHAFAKELLAGFVGGEVDKLAETRGMNAYDRERAHHHAKEGSKEMYDQHYGGQDQYDPSYGPPQQIQNYGGDGNDRY